MLKLIDAQSYLNARPNSCELKRIKTGMPGGEPGAPKIGKGKLIEVPLVVPT